MNRELSHPPAALHARVRLPELRVALAARLRRRPAPRRTAADHALAPALLARRAQRRVRPAADGRRAEHARLVALPVCAHRHE